MPNNKQTQMDDLINQIGNLGRIFNKSLPPAVLKIEAQKLKGFCEELLAMLPK